MSTFRLTLDLEVADSRRSPWDTRRRAARAAQAITAYAGRLRHVRAVAATRPTYLPAGQTSSEVEVSVPDNSGFSVLSVTRQDLPGGPSSADLPTCPDCAEVVHDADCALVGDGRPVDGEGST